jgi:hypothetical protein
MGEKRNAYRILVGKPEEKRPLGRLERRWEDNTKIDLREIRMGWYILDSSGSGQTPVEGSYEQANKLLDSIKCWEFLE